MVTYCPLVYAIYILSKAGLEEEDEQGFNLRGRHINNLCCADENTLIDGNAKLLELKLSIKKMELRSKKIKKRSNS